MTATAIRPSAVAGGDVSWQPPIKGAFGSSFRLGEWITGPVTPLFEDWALTRLEAAMHAWHLRSLGQPAPLPHHVVINGWYFYSLAWLPVTASALLRWAPRLIPHLLRHPRRVAPVIPPTAHLGIDILEREWREDLLPSFLATADRARRDVEEADLEALPRLIDEQLDAAGEYFGSVTAVGGAAYKFEYQLARFYRRHLEPTIGGSHLDLLVGLTPPVVPPAHAVETLDWAYPTLGERSDPVPDAAARTDLLRARREEHETAARAAVAGSKRQAKQFEDLLTRAQHFNVVREEQMREFTRAWPALRYALTRLGTWLMEHGLLREPDDIFYLRRDELHDAIDRRPTAELTLIADARRGDVQPGHRHRESTCDPGRERLRLTRTGRGPGGAHDRAGLDAALRPRLGRGHRRRQCLLPCVGRGPGIRHPCGRRLRRCHPSAEERSARDRRRIERDGNASITEVVHPQSRARLAIGRATNRMAPTGVARGAGGNDDPESKLERSGRHSGPHAGSSASRGPGRC
jgi:hypothetical protein